MDIYRRKQRWKQVLLIAAMLIGSGSLFYTNQLVSEIEATERRNMELWSEAVRMVASSGFESELAFPFSVIESNQHIPVILTDQNDSIIYEHNLDSTRTRRPGYIEKQLKKAKAENDSLLIPLSPGNYQLLYYRNSDPLRQLAYFPYIQLLVIILFIGVAYLAFSSTRKAEQNEVWTGMSKETAHQLGTPISSLIGWVELMKQGLSDQNTIKEMEKDIQRLNKITDRFSKIGSKPALQRVNLSSILAGSLDYIRQRGPASVEYLLDVPEQEIFAQLNSTLFEWVIENLCKNATDATGGDGRVILHAAETETSVIIDVEDNGKGILKSNFNTIFKPGYTTKLRGWGLGLSLSKRIIEDYHNGKIFVLSSQANQSTVIRVLLRK